MFAQVEYFLTVFTSAVSKVFVTCALYLSGANVPAAEADTLGLIDLVETSTITEYQPIEDNIRRQSLLQSFLAKNNLSNYKLAVSYMPLPRARLHLEQSDWCLSFIPPINAKHFQTYLLNDDKVKLILYRKRQVSDFSWQALSELKGSTIAVMRDYKGSSIKQYLLDNGLIIVEVFSFETAIKLLAKGRVEYALARHDTLDNMHLGIIDKDQLQASSSSVVEFYNYLFVHNSCAIIDKITISQPVELPSLHRSKQAQP
ncbi:hypothetical protein ACMZOO_11220 [Catenovulum sp. SX2]|uniref:hypothetical protein n=1 Tax=Catenovulum sp. SX2 TaxID=3398614 RepID=UPI003F850E0C